VGGGVEDFTCFTRVIALPTRIFVWIHHTGKGRGKKAFFLLCSSEII
jgi:hypothetical protein